MAKRFNLPDKIKVNGHVIAVKEVDMVAKDNPGIVGRAYLAQNRILIGKFWRGQKLADDHRRETFLHELLHHISDKHQCKMSERQVDAMSRGLFAAIKDNDLGRLWR